MIYAVDIGPIVAILSPVISKYAQPEWHDALLHVWIGEVLFEIFSRPTSSWLRDLKPMLIADMNIPLTGVWFAKAIMYNHDIVDALADPRCERWIDNGSLFIKTRSCYGSSVSV